VVFGGLSLPFNRPALWLSVSGAGIALILYGRSQWITGPGLTRRQTKTVLRHLHAQQQYEKALNSEQDSNAVPRKPRPLPRKTAEALRAALDASADNPPPPVRNSSPAPKSKSRSVYDEPIDHKWKITRN
jgi:hypothetical protein